MATEPTCVMPLDSDVPIGMTFGAAFYGYTIGAALFGITITQAYHYFMTSFKYGHKWQHYVVIGILILDTLHFGFAIHMMYTYMISILGDSSVCSEVVWSLKAMGSVQVFFTIFVQALYLQKIWAFSHNQLLTPRFSTILRGVVIGLSLVAIAVGVVFLLELQRIKEITNFDLRFQYVIYVGFGATSLIDMGIAAAMCLMLHKSTAGTKRSAAIIVTLIQYIVGTGLLTSLGALLIMVLYIAFPKSLLYLGVEYSMTRLYAISVLALYNSQSRLRDKLNETMDLNGASMLYFAEPGKIISHRPRITHTRGTSELESDDLDHTGQPLQHRHGGRSDTLESSVGTSPTTRRHIMERIFENVDAEDTLVERNASHNGTPYIITRNGRRHYTA